MTLEHTPVTDKYTRSWYTFVGFNSQGRPQLNTETHTVEISNFDEYFIHYLSDYLPTITMNPDGDGLDRLQEFKELYIQTLLEAKREYVKDSYVCP